MAKNVFNTAVRFFNILVFKYKGLKPTVPVLLDINQQNPLWKQATDLNDGEYAVNNIDNIIYYRIGSQIFTFDISQIANVISLSHARLHALNSTLDHSSSIPQGDLMEADVNGLPADSGISAASISGSSNAGNFYIIPTGITVKVQNNHQYAIKNHLYLTGGHIVLNGNAQLMIM